MRPPGMPARGRGTAAGRTFSTWAGLRHNAGTRADGSPCMKHCFAALALLLLPLLAAAQSSAPGNTGLDPRALKPGQFLWHPEIAPQGPIVLVVSLDEQLAYVYRNGIAIGVSTISSGKTGKETPTGVFTILQKNKDHRSNLYNDAPMPYMQRLTWDGIALHGGTLPGYPASHGCVRLPVSFAEKLFAETRTGDTVVVANARTSAASLSHPAVLAPVSAKGEAAGTFNIHAGYYWDTDRAGGDGPVSILVSVADKRVFVLRNGVTVGEAGLDVDADFVLDGSVLMVVGNPSDEPPSAAAAADRQAWQWSVYPILGIGADALPLLQQRLQGRPLRVDGGFARHVYELLAPGTTLLLTDLPALRADPSAQPLGPLLESDEPAPIP